MVFVWKQNTILLDEDCDDDDSHDDDDDDVDDGFWKQNTNLLSKGIISASKSYDFFFRRK